MVISLTDYLEKKAQKRYPCPVCDSSDGLAFVPGEGRGVGAAAEWSAVGYVYCHSCAAHWNAVRWLMDYEGYADGKEAMEALGMREAHAEASAKSRGHTVPRKKRKPILRPTKISRPPGNAWQSQAARIRAKATKALRSAIDGDGSPFATACLRALRSRGISDATTYAAHLGCLETGDWTPAEKWGIDPSNTKDGTVGLPRGVLIPWATDPHDMTGDVWTLRVRRPKGDVHSGPKYLPPKGGSGTGLFVWGRLPNRPVVLVEGELDALHTASVAEDICTPVATGSISGARRVQHTARLKAASVVLVAYDNEDTPQVKRAARWWLDRLPSAIRWRPLVPGGDPCDMHRAGIDTRAWVRAGIEYATMQ